VYILAPLPLPRLALHLNRRDDPATVHGLDCLGPKTLTPISILSQGLAIGSAQFIESVFEGRREAFPARRIDGTRKIRGVSWGRLHALRDLRGS